MMQICNRRLESYLETAFIKMDVLHFMIRAFVQKRSLVPMLFSLLSQTTAVFVYSHLGHSRYLDNALTKSMSSGPSYLPCFNTFETSSTVL